MRFSEFYNKTRNTVQQSTVRKINTSIPISEEREKFFNGDLFKKYDQVISEGIRYRILEQCSNYYQVVDVSNGNVSRKFAHQLTKVEHNGECLISEDYFHGYNVKTDNGKEFLKKNFKRESLDNDDVGILKQLKEADKMDQPYKSKDKLTVAKIIADAVGIPHDAVSTPENLVNAAIRKAKKDPALMKNKEILSNMLQIAKEVGIKYSDNTFEVNEVVHDVDHMSGAVHYDKTKLRGHAMSDYTVSTNSKNGHPEKKVTVSATSSNHAKNLAGEHFSNLGLKNGTHFDGLRIVESIVKTDSGYRLVSKKTGKNLGDFDSKEAAEKHEREVEYFKHQNESVEISEADEQEHFKNAMNRIKPEKRDAARKAYTTMRAKGHTHAAALSTMHNTFSESVEEIDEISRNTVDSYLEKSKESKPNTLKKVMTRFASRERAYDRVHRDELNKIGKKNESVEDTVDKPITLKDLRKKLKGGEEQLDTSLSKDDEVKTTMEPPASTMNGDRSNTHRKMIINKLQGN